MATKVGILASGSGTTAEAFAQSIDSGEISGIEIAVIVHNNPNAGIIDQPTIKKLGVPTVCINTANTSNPGDTLPPRGEVSKEESRVIAKELDKHEVKLVLLLGYMKKVDGELLDQCGFNPDRHNYATDTRMLNLHPGPLPQTAGLHGEAVHEKSYKLYQQGNLAEVGPTLHAVAAGYDTGPEFSGFSRYTIKPSDTVGDVEDNVRLIERTEIGPLVAQFAAKAHLQ